MNVVPSQWNNSLVPNCQPTTQVVVNRPDAAQRGLLTFGNLLGWIEGGNPVLEGRYSAKSIQLNQESRLTNRKVIVVAQRPTDHHAGQEIIDPEMY